MAEKRMFSKKIIDTDWFMEMPASTQNLYFHLSMRADDDGFVASPKRIIKLIGANDDDYKILISKKFVIPFESGICVITDWRINNYLRSDRYTETIYQDEKNMLNIDENNRYGIPLGIPNGYLEIPISNSISNSSNIYNIKENNKESEIGQDWDNVPKKTKRFVKPTLEEVKSYCEERKNNVDAERFVDFYESKGWKVGNQAMKDWKACVRTWEKKETKTNDKDKANFTERKYTKEELNVYDDLENFKW